MIRSINQFIDEYEKFIRNSKIKRKSFRPVYDVSNDGERLICTVAPCSIVEISELKSLGGNTKLYALLSSAKFSATESETFDSMCNKGIDNTFKEFGDLRDIDESDKSFLTKVFKSQSTLKQYKDIVLSDKGMAQPLHHGGKILIRISDSFFNVDIVYAMVKAAGNNIKISNSTKNTNGLCIESDNVKWYLMPFYMENFIGEKLDEYCDNIAEKFMGVEPKKRRTSDEKFNDEIVKEMTKYNKDKIAYDDSDEGKIYIPILNDAAILIPTNNDIKNKFENSFSIKNRNLSHIKNLMNGGTVESIDSSFFSKLDTYEKEFIKNIYSNQTKYVFFALSYGFFNVDLFKAFYKVNQKDVSGLTFRFMKHSTDKSATVCYITGAKNFDMLASSLMRTSDDLNKKTKKLTKKILGNIFTK